MQLWDRQPTEPMKAYRAFTVYRDLGEQRTLKQAARNMSRSATLLRHWSALHGWVARCAAYDSAQRAIAQAGYEAGIRAEAARWAERQNVQRDSEWEMARALMSKAGAMLRFPLATATQTEDDEGRIVTIVQPARWNLKDAATMVDTAARLARLAANMAVPGGASLPAQEQVVPVALTTSQTSSQDWTRLAHSLPIRLRMSRYVPSRPHPAQTTALLVPATELLYGGAAGGGKSEWLLMAALQYVDVPGYAALLLRRTYPELAMPGAIMDRAHGWLRGTDARWNASEHTYTFPSGATLTFGYLQAADDQYRYQSAEFQFIGFDELTEFKEAQYRFLFSRLRRLAASDLPLRMRAATNPGGPGHEWVKQRFIIEGRALGRVFIPARLARQP